MKNQNENQMTAEQKGKAVILGLEIFAQVCPDDLTALITKMKAVATEMKFSGEADEIIEDLEKAANLMSEIE